MAAPHRVTSIVSAERPHLEVVENLQTVKFHGSVRVPDLHEDIDWTLEVPEEGLTYDGLTLLLPGLGCVKRHSRGERHANAVAGEATISYDPARISGSIAENLLASQKLPGATADAVLSDVQRLFKGRPVVPNARQIDPHKVTLSPHSMGGYSATILGLKRTSEIDAVIYKAAAGFGTPSWRAPQQLKLGRTLMEIAEYVASDEVDLTVRNLWRSAYYFGRSPSRSLGELITCLTTDISGDIDALAAEVPTAYLGFELDGLVPVKPVEPIAREIVDIFHVLPGVGHIAPQRYSALTTAATRELRSQLRP